MTDPATKTADQSKFHWWHLPVFILIVTPPIKIILFLYLDFWVLPIIKWWLS